MCVEFVAAVAWLAELFPNPQQRESALGYTQAFSSFGGLLVAGRISGHCTNAKFPAIELPSFSPFSAGSATPCFVALHADFRLIPAIPLIVIRPFLPESPVWAAEEAAGTLKRPSLAEFFAPLPADDDRDDDHVRVQLRGGLRRDPADAANRAALSEVRRQAEGQAAARKRRRSRPRGRFGQVQEIGGLVGRFLLAILAVRILSRRRLLRIFQIPGLDRAGRRSSLPTTASCSIWDRGRMTTYPLRHLHLRPVHGRAVQLLGQLFAVCLSGSPPRHGRELRRQYRRPNDRNVVRRGDEFARRLHFRADPAKMAYTAAGVGFAVYLVGSIACFWLPEPKEGPSSPTPSCPRRKNRSSRPSDCFAVPLRTSAAKQSQSAVHDDRLAIHVSVEVRDEEDGEVGHLGEGADTAQRAVLQIVREAVIGHVAADAVLEQPRHRQRTRRP